jgi:hypothetical protein
MLACFLSACLFPDLSGLGGGANDAGTDTPNVDVARNDGVAPSAFCASQSPAHSFCDDFDDGAPLLADGGAYPPWGYGTATYGSTLTLDSTKPRSSPYAMLSETFPQTGAFVYPTAYVAKFIPAGVSLITLGADVQIERVDPSPGGTVIFTLIVADASFPLVVSSQTGAAHVADDYADPDGAAQTPQLGQAFTLVVGQWMRLVYTVDVGANTVALTMDPGTGVVQVLHATPAIHPFTATSPAIYVGIYYSHATTTGSAIDYDDVTIDWN